MAYSAVQLATALGARAIVTPSVSGRTARQVSRLRPPMPIIAVVPTESVARRLALTWGVQPVIADLSGNTDEVMVAARDAALHAGLVNHADLVVLTAGVPVGLPTRLTSVLEVP